MQLPIAISCLNPFFEHHVISKNAKLDYFSKTVNFFALEQQKTMRRQLLVSKKESKSTLVHLKVIQIHFQQNHKI